VPSPLCTHSVIVSPRAANAERAFVARRGAKLMDSIRLPESARYLNWFELFSETGPPFKAMNS
jgi:hypothetical protein